VRQICVFGFKSGMIMGGSDCSAAFQKQKILKDVTNTNELDAIAFGKSKC
jgi:hypothetical protein